MRTRAMGDVDVAQACGAHRARPRHPLDQVTDAASAALR